MRQSLDRSDVRLLDPDEPAPVVTLLPDAPSPFVFACDHAGNRIPRRLRALGLDPHHLEQHIAWDIGALAVARMAAASLSAAVVGQRYSRLVIDCNRRPDRPDSIKAVSDGIAVPGNHDLDDDAREVRRRAIFAPYHERLSALLDARAAAGVASVLVALHSFTPRLGEEERPWHISVMHDDDARLASALLDEVRAEPDLCVGHNEPYVVDVDNDYTVPVHAQGRGLLHVEIELRQDLIAGAEGQAAWSDRLARWLTTALERTGSRA